jgi:hypothetical protein
MLSTLKQLFGGGVKHKIVSHWLRVEQVNDPRPKGIW